MSLSINNANILVLLPRVTQIYYTSPAAQRRTWRAVIRHLKSYEFAAEWDSNICTDKQQAEDEWMRPKRHCNAIIVTFHSEGLWMDAQQDRVG